MQSLLKYHKKPRIRFINSRWHLIDFENLDVAHFATQGFNW